MAKVNQIDIERRLPIINGFIVVPDAPLVRLTPSEAIDLIPGSDTKVIDDREWLILPAFDREDSTSADFFRALRIGSVIPSVVSESVRTVRDVPVFVNGARGVDGVSVVSVVGPSNGVVSKNSDGSFVYKANSGFVGTDSFRYIVVDEDGGRASASVSVNVARFYQVIDIGDLGGGISDTTGGGHNVNSFGDSSGVTIDGGGSIVGFVWDFGTQTMESVGLLSGGTTSSTNALNDSKQATGTANVSGGETHGFLFSGGVLTDLGDLGGAGGTTAVGHDINNDGVICGRAKNGAGQQRPARWDGSWEDLGTLGGTNGSARGINNKGTIVGEASTGSTERAFRILPGGSMEDLGSLPGDDSEAIDVNEFDEVCGQSKDSGGNNVPMFWTPDQGMVSIGTFGGDAGQATSINDAFVIVGFADNIGGDDRAFLWENGTMHNLNDFIQSDFANTLGRANTINNAGMILTVDPSVFKIFLLVP